MTTTDTQEPADPETTAADPGARPSGRRGPNPFVLAALVLVVVAGGLATWFGVGWLRAANDDDLAVAGVRDEVSRVGAAALVTFTSIDHNRLDEGLDRWEGVTTGPLRDEVVRRRADTRAAFDQAKTVATGTILKFAVTELREREGKAVAIAAVMVNVGVDGKPGEGKQMRLQVGLDRTPEGWKLSSFAPVQNVPAG
ncbi:nuclear transport factor 2 family protein [Actinokineospora auranticolor]|uniref:Mce-associated membrane protein n=1 Tax=Actinokineospora auranticolor TaxID=155976 RepID=A0A2S6GW94_9PSEU|nr:nuclear transport factor 2 family protein [Actinokineospora auranticolor]PPK69515.1 Mce-associated membrane protein [Actinokineospora auranticolor]